MEEILEQLENQDDRLVGVFHREEIDDLETFLQLDERDYVRLNLTTKQIKFIQRLQQHYRLVTVEWLNEEQSAVATQVPIVSQESTVDVCTLTDPGPSTASSSHVLPTSPNTPCSKNTTPSLAQLAFANPDESDQKISLEKPINIDHVLEKSEKGRVIMEILKEKAKPKESTIKEIVNVLCDFLKSQYGCRPSNFHKNQVAVSLVCSYPALAADSSDTPQALWFHLHARGTNRHAGRIHYRMEYLARMSQERIRPPRRTISESQEIPNFSNGSSVNLDEAENELRFIVPSQQIKSRVFELWNATFENRQKYRSEGSFYSYVQNHPVLTAFNGKLITNDFHKLKPSAKPFVETWTAMEGKIISNNREVYTELKNDFVRALSIIRLKNPSRGSKRVREENANRKNPLNGIVQWINAEDDFPSNRDEKSVPTM
ncbi:uncharacterized protein LOC110677020 [Aedes aegypti]|uniref:Uncharacterized protein n=1 Tax=Aedes aegypti TaxID=7159 RepID=A0A6I8TZ59_AEDAE|nr:uncharacterized protein LOC110677020 [Aedes aegypti]